MLGNFIRKNFKTLAIIVVLIVFFFLYNTYLVDRSLINLRIALNRTAEAKNIDDFAKIKSLLKIPLLNEVSITTTSAKILLSMEASENITDTAKDFDQVQDIKFYLNKLIKDKEKARGGFLSFLDRINSYIFAPTVELSKDKLKKATRDLAKKIKSIKDKQTLQLAYYYLGDMYVQLSDLPRAEEAFIKAVEVDSKSNIALKTRFNLAWAYKVMGLYDKAISYFEELSQEFPQTYLAVTSQYQIADALFKKGDYKAARDKYAQLAADQPKFEAVFVALYQAGSISLYELDDFKSALKFFREFAISQAGYISFYKLNDLTGASRYYSELEEDPTSDIAKHIRTTTRNTMAKDFRKTGFQFLKDKKYTEAIENFEKAVKIAPYDSHSFSGMGLGFYWEEKKEEALNKVGQAIDISPDDEVIMVNYMFVYINSANPDEAIRIGEEFISKRKTIKRPEFYYNLGYAYALKGKMDEASTYFNGAIRLNSDFVFAYNNLGCVLWTKSNYSEAIRKFQEAIARDRDYADAYFNLGVSYFYLNRFEESYAQFQLALDVNPNYKEADAYLKRIEEIVKYHP